MKIVKDLDGGGICKTGLGLPEKWEQRLFNCFLLCCAQQNKAEAGGIAATEPQSICILICAGNWKGM